MTEKNYIDLDFDQGFWSTKDKQLATIHLATYNLETETLEKVFDFQKISPDQKKYLQDLVKNDNQLHLTISIQPEKSTMSFSIDGYSVYLPLAGIYIKEEYKQYIFESIQEKLNNPQHKQQIGQHYEQYKKTIDSINNELTKNNKEQNIIKKFNWDNFTEKQYNSLKEKINTGQVKEGFLGAINIGSICIEFVQDDKEYPYLVYNFYVLGQNYNYEGENFSVPYSYESGEIIEHSFIKDSTYNNFKANVEQELTKNIANKQHLKQAADTQTINWHDRKQVKKFYEDKIEKDKQLITERTLDFFNNFEPKLNLELEHLNLITEYMNNDKFSYQDGQLVTINEGEIKERGVKDIFDFVKVNIKEYIANAMMNNATTYVHRLNTDLAKIQEKINILQDRENANYQYSIDLQSLFNSKNPDSNSVKLENGFEIRKSIEDDNEYYDLYDSQNHCLCCHGENVQVLVRNDGIYSLKNNDTKYSNDSFFTLNKDEYMMSIPAKIKNLINEQKINIERFGDEYDCGLLKDKIAQVIFPDYKEDGQFIDVIHIYATKNNNSDYEIRFERQNPDTGEWKDIVLNEDIPSIIKDKLNQQIKLQQINTYTIKESSNSDRQQWVSIYENNKQIYSKDTGNLEKWYDYDEKGNEIHLKTSDDFEIWTDYDEKGNEIHYKDNQGTEVWKNYDEKGNEIHYKDSIGYEKWTTVEDATNQVYSKDSNGLKQWTEYDQNGNEIHHKDSAGYEIWYKYDKNNNLIYSEELYGYEKWYSYDQKGNCIHEKDSEGFEQWRKYDEKGNEIHYKNTNGHESWTTIKEFESPEKLSVDQIIEKFSLESKSSPLQIIEKEGQVNQDIGSYFKRHLLEQLKTTNNPFVAAAVIVEDLKITNPGKLEQLNNYLKENNCTTKKGFETFFKDVIGLKEPEKSKENKSKASYERQR